MFGRVVLWDIVTLLFYVFLISIQVSKPAALPALCQLVTGQKKVPARRPCSKRQWLYRQGPGAATDKLSPADVQKPEEPSPEVRRLLLHPAPVDLDILASGGALK